MHRTVKISYSEIYAIPLFIALICLAVWQGIKLQSYERRPLLYPGDIIYVRSAENLWARKVGENIEFAMRNRYPIAVHFKDYVCIQLTLKVGSAGGNPTYCFDKMKKT